MGKTSPRATATTGKYIQSEWGIQPRATGGTRPSAARRHATRLKNRAFIHQKPESDTVASKSQSDGLGAFRARPRGCLRHMHTYLKSIDLTKTGLAVPVVDELATSPLDLGLRTMRWKLMVTTNVGLLTRVNRQNSLLRKLLRIAQNYIPGKEGRNRFADPTTSTPTRSGYWDSLRPTPASDDTPSSHC
jgi:hypothetical protein